MPHLLIDKRSMHESREGGGGGWGFECLDPLENLKAVGFLKNTGPDSLLPSQHSMFDHDWPVNETPLSGVLLYGQ